MHRRFPAPVLALLFVVPALAADPPQWAVLRGETSDLSLADPGAEVLLGAGFREREDTGDSLRIWTERQVDLLIVLDSGENRSLVLAAGESVVGTRVEALLDGSTLGTATIGEGVLSWALPTVRAGPHHLRLRASAPPGAEGLPWKRALALGWIELRGPHSALAPPSLTPVHFPAELAPGSRLIGRLTVGPRLGLEVAGSKGVLSQAALVVDQGPTRPTSLAPDGSRARWTNPRPRLGFVVVPTEQHTPTRIDSLEVEPPLAGAALRLTSGLWYAELAALMVLAGIAWLLRRPLRAWLYDEDPSRRRLVVDLVVVFVVALGLRLLWIAAYPEPPVNRLGDEIEYLHRARSLAQDWSTFWSSDRWRLWQTWTRAPGYYVLLAALETTSGSRGSLFLVQALLGAVACVGVAKAAQALAPGAPRLAGLAAGLLLAINLETINTTTWVMSEALMLATVGLGFAALAGTMKRPSLGSGVLAGLILGAGALVRSTGLHYLPLLGFAVLCLPRESWRRKLGAAAGLALGFALVIVPWAVRSSRVAGSSVVIDTVATANLLQYHRTTGFVASDDLDLDTPVGSKKYYRRVQRANQDGEMAARHGEILRAVVVGLAQDPFAWAKRTIDNLGTFFVPFADWYLERLAPEDNFVRLALLTDLLNISYFVLLVPGLLGLLWGLRQRRSWFLIAWIGLIAGVICLLFQPDFIPGRYRMPTLPAFAILAGGFLADRMRPPLKTGRPEEVRRA